MLPKTPKNAVFLLSFLLALSACSLPKKSAQQQQIDPIPFLNWSLFGKIAFNNGQQGGSGRINWQSENGLIKAEFKAPLGQGNLKLDEQQGQISDAQTTVQGTDMGILLSRQIGWQVPWQQLKNWINGQFNNQSDILVRQTKQGIELKQQGWTIHYRKIKSVQGLMLPHQIFIRKGDKSIKLSIRNWILPTS